MQLRYPPRRRRTRCHPGQGDVAFASKINELGLLSKQVDDLAYKMAPNAQSRKYLFVFRKDFLSNEPRESVALKPLSKKRCAWGPDRTSLFECRLSGDEYRSVHDPSRLFSSAAQPLSPVNASS
jgi:hypothetical protein